MEMGDGDSGGGFGVGLLFDTSGLGLFGTLLLIGAMVGLTMYCNAQKHEQWRDFCTDVCSQYGDAPVIQGSQCYCRDEHGVYDPGQARCSTR